MKKKNNNKQKQQHKSMLKLIIEKFFDFGIGQSAIGQQRASERVKFTTAITENKFTTY